MSNITFAASINDDYGTEEPIQHSWAQSPTKYSKITQESQNHVKSPFKMHVLRNDDLAHQPNSDCLSHLILLHEF